MRCVGAVGPTQVGLVAESDSERKLEESLLLLMLCRLSLCTSYTHVMYNRYDLSRCGAGQKACCFEVSLVVRLCQIAEYRCVGCACCVHTHQQPPACFFRCMLHGAL